MGLSLWDALINALVGTWEMARGTYKYSPLPHRNPIQEARESLSFWARNHQRILKGVMAVMAAFILWYLAAATAYVFVIIRVLEPTAPSPQPILSRPSHVPTHPANACHPGAW